VTRPATAGRGWPTAVAAATVVAVARPGSWLVGLAGWLARGGLAVVAAPIIVLPTYAGLATALGPIVIALALGTPDAERLGLLAGGAGIVLAAGLLGVVVGAATDATLIRWTAEDLDGWLVPLGSVAPDGRLPDHGRRTRGIVGRVLAVRLLAHLPLLVVGTWAAVVVGDAVYRVLMSPGDATTPILVRVVGASPVAVIAVVVAWALGEALGGIAARRVVIDGTGVGRGLGEALGHAVRHPVGTLLTIGLALAGTFGLIAPALAAAAVSWEALRTGLREGDDVGAAVLALVAFLVTWLGALVLAALAAAWRAALWTAEVLRHRTGAAPG
jgi:hypothetical protein